MKAFNVGLNLDAPVDELNDFFTKNSELLDSVYFSLPLGQSYYSRGKLTDEYKDNDSKLLEIIDIIRYNGIKTEVVLNTALNHDQVNVAIDYIYTHNIIPDEIACQNSSLSLLKSAFPSVSFTSCYNNGTKEVDKRFDSIVLGQSYLRDISKRNEWINKGFNIILLLNNGCSFFCNPNIICSLSCCKNQYARSRQNMSASEVYAQQSFFPEELRALALTDSCFFDYRFKISTRPLGLDYTRSALNAYARMLNTSEFFFEQDHKNYLLFGAMSQLALHFDEMTYGEIMSNKHELYPLKITKE